jgi:peptide/nickel transport system substrate-binding protein
VRRPLVALLFTALATLIAAPLRADPPPAAQTLRIGLEGDINTVQPLAVTTQMETWVTNLMFDTLLVYDEHLALRPDLATAVPTRANGGISADGKTIVVHLRPGVTWHDGQPFTAGDVAFTVRAVLDPKNVVPNRTPYTIITSVATPDPHTVVFHLAKPQATFFAGVLAGYAIVPAHLLAHSANLATDAFGEHPVGTGPYRFVRWVRGDHLDVIANPSYFGGAPKIANVRVQMYAAATTMGLALRQHEIDYAETFDPANFDQLRHDPGLAVAVEPFADFSAIAIDRARPLLRDDAVRRAIVAAIDRTAVARRATFGLFAPAYADMPPAMYGVQPPAGWDRADPAAAAALLDRAGWKRGPDGIRAKNGVPLRLDLIVWSGYAAGESAVIQVQQMLRRVGIDTAIKAFPISLYFAPAAQGGPVMGNRFDLAYFAFGGGDDVENDNLYTCANRAPAGFNVEQLCDPRMDALQTAANAEYDPARRLALVARIEDLAVRDTPFAFLWYNEWLLVGTPSLHRTHSSYDNPWYGIARWTLDATPAR